MTTTVILAGILAACDLSPTAPNTGVEGTITAGAFHTCRLTESGAAFCWGDNGAGQLGNGTLERRKVPTPVSGGIAFRTISAGFVHTCGLTGDDTAYCWGNNGGGSLGDGTRVSKVVPEATAGEAVFQSISAGGFHTCGLTKGGVAYCWGSNASGQLGVRTGTTICDRTPCNTTPIRVAGDLVLVALSAGIAHTCGITPDGAAYCWGLNAGGQLGNGFFATATAPVLVTGQNTFVQLSAGGSHTCGLTADGTAYCWGLNQHGQLGTDSVPDRCLPQDLPCTSIPVQLDSSLRFLSISAGSDHTCGIARDEAAHCWGNNSSAQLGNGSVFDRAEPQQVLGGITFRTITAGENHTCASTPGGEAFCWGDNFRFQLGNGGIGIRKSQPEPVLLPEGL